MRRTIQATRCGACFLLFLAVGLTALFTLMLPSAAQAATRPRINSVTPSQGPVGTYVIITGTNFGGTVGSVSFNGITTTTGIWFNGTITTRVPDGATSGPVTVTTSAGTSNGVNFVVTGTPGATQTWYLAEGSTAHGFETYVLMENTTAVDATVNVVYNTQQYGRIPRPQAINIPSNSRVTLRVNDDIPNVDVSTEVRSSQKIVCERAMYWSDRIEGTDSIGVTQPAKTWYLAEGCTLPPFETWVLIQNPSIATPAKVNITYMTSNGVIQKGTIEVGAGQRTSIDVSKDVGQCNVSTKVESDKGVICERAMYWNHRRGGHDSIGVTGGSKTWYLAEGSSAWGFETWLLLQNPSKHAAKVDVRYMTSAGPVAQPTFTMPPDSRETIRVNDKVRSLDTSIQVSSDREIIAERAMYWDNGTGRAGHDTIGMTAPATTIYLAEGSTAWGFETFVCIQNPNSKSVTVTVTYLTNYGPINAEPLNINPNSRVTINVNSELPDKDASIKITSTSLPVMAERAMYWNDKGAGHVSIGWVPQ